MQKEKILIEATGGSRWIGGLYYKRNIVFSLLQNTEFKNKYEIVLITESENIDVFRPFEDSIKIYLINYKYQKERRMKIFLCALKNGCKYMFPCLEEQYCRLFKIKGINWIPDFQHYHLPDFFAGDEREKREKEHHAVALSDFPLVLSSENCKTDFESFCSKEKSNVYVVPFVSYIEPELEQITIELEECVLKKYKLADSRYIFIANQFWKHKNHIIVFKAIREWFIRHPKSGLHFIFTGKMQDNKALDYVETLKEYFNDEMFQQHCMVLGFIDRLDQIVLMKNSLYVIQPSLFEGWGTVVEDAKVLNKRILLSDIPVHREQKNENCFLFNPNNEQELVNLMEYLERLDMLPYSNKGIENMYINAKRYSINYMKMLDELRKGK